MSDPNEENQMRHGNVQTNHEQNNYATANTTEEVEGERNREEQRPGDKNDDNSDAAIQASPPQCSNLEINQDTKTTVTNQEKNRMSSELEDEDTDSGHTLTKEISQYIDTVEKSGSDSYYGDYPGTESITYDYTGERQTQYTRTTNLLESTAHLIKGCLGAGILTMHEAYMRGGLWTSLAATCIIGIIVPYTMFILVRSAQTMYARIRVPRLSYPDLAEAAVATGPWKCCRKYSKIFRYTVDVCLFIQLCGTCCVYEIMIAQTVKQAMEAVSSTIHAWQLPIKMYILIVTVHLLLVCLIRSLKYLAPFSLIADCSIGICVLITLYYSLKSEQRNIHDRPAWKSLEGLYRFCGVCIFSVDGVGIALPIENNMTKPKYFNVVLQCGMIIVFVCITIVGFFGYWAWGETCRSPITVHMPVQHYVVPVVLQFLLSLMLSVTFALSFWVPFRIVWHYLARRHKRKRGWWERLYRAIHVMVITALAIAVPDVHEIMSFLGDFLLAFNGFIFPAFIESMVTWKDHRKGRIRWTLIKDLMIMVLGLFLGFGAIYMNLRVK